MKKQELIQLIESFVRKQLNEIVRGKKVGNYHIYKDNDKDIVIALNGGDPYKDFIIFSSDIETISHVISGIIKISNSTYAGDWQSVDSYSGTVMIEKKGDNLYLSNTDDSGKSELLIPKHLINQLIKELKKL